MADAMSQPNRALAEQHLQRGLDHYDRQEAEQALTAYQDCIKADPSFALGYNNLGMVLIDLERYDEAEAALHHSIQCDPNYAEAYNNLGFMLRRLQRNIEAASAYARFVELEPELEEAPRIKGWMETVKKENNLSELPPFAPMVQPVEAAQAPADPPKIKKMSGWEMPQDAPPPGDPQTLSYAPTAAAAPAAAHPAAPAAAHPAAPAAAAAAPLPKIKKSQGWEMALAEPPANAPDATLSYAPAPDAAGPAATAPAPQLQAQPAPLLAAGASAAPAPVLQAAPRLGAAPAARAAASASARAAAPVLGAAPVAAAAAASGAGLAAAARKAGPPAPLLPPKAAPAPLQAQPVDIISLIERGMDQFSEGNLTEAVTIFQQAVATDPKNAEAHTGLGKIFVRQEKLEEGIAQLRQAVELDPNDPACWYVLGFALRAAEQNIEAAQAYEKFLALMPQAVDADKMRQWITHIKGLAGHGTMILEDASVLDDEQIVTETDQKYKDASTLFQEGKLDAAVRKCVNILNEDPAHFRTRVLLGRGFLRQKHYDNAVEQLEGALVTRPDYPEALFFLGQACEKQGNAERAFECYKRYLEVAPSGPRAERLRDWLMSKGPLGGGSAPADADKTLQCELCLRFFTEKEITQYEGKATCRNCLAVMGASPVLAPSLAQAPAPSAQSGSTPDLPESSVPEQPKKRSRALALGAVLLLVLGGAGATAFYLGLLDPMLKPPANKVVNRPTNNLPIAPPPVDRWEPTHVKVANEPQPVARAFAQWTYAPKLDGVDDLEKKLPGAKITYALAADAPQGMSLNKDNVLTWVPQPSDAASLRAGAQVKVELTINIVDKDQKPLFTTSKTLNLWTQFGYEYGPALDLGLGARETVVLGLGDLNSDTLPDLVLASGEYRKGGAQVYIHRQSNPLPVPTPLCTGARYSAVYVGDLTGNATDDVMVANWNSGELQLFSQENQQLPGGAKYKVGAGPVAITGGDVDGDKQFEAAVLLGMGRSLEILRVHNKGFAPLAQVALPSGGAQGYVFPWRSPQAGPGFLAIVPVAESPLIFVGANNGEWNKGAAPILSAVESGCLIVGAAVLKSTGQRDRLVLATAGMANRLLLFEETDGKFSSSSEPVSVPALVRGLLAADFNSDGQDDLLVVGPESLTFYFAMPGTGSLLAGPQLGTQSAMHGAGVVFRHTPHGPELLLVDAERKAHFAKPLLVEYKPEAVEPKLEAKPAPSAAPAAEPKAPAAEATDHK